MKTVVGRFFMTQNAFTRDSGKWKTIQFKDERGRYLFKDDEQIVVQVLTQSFIGTETPGLRIRGIDQRLKGNNDLPPTKYGFQIRFNGVYYGNSGSNGKHDPEFVGWVAYGAKTKNTDPKAEYAVISQDRHRVVFNEMPFTPI